MIKWVKLGSIYISCLIWNFIFIFIWFYFMCRHTHVLKAEHSHLHSSISGSISLWPGKTAVLLVSRLIGILVFFSEIKIVITSLMERKFVKWFISIIRFACNCYFFLVISNNMKIVIFSVYLFPYFR